MSDMFGMPLVGTDKEVIASLKQQLAEAKESTKTLMELIREKDMLLAELTKGWSQYLKEDETPLQRLEREIADNHAVLTLLAEAKKDAERYRWLRSKDTGPSQIWELLSEDCQPPHMTLKTEAELDAAIDQAMR